ncbi:MAG: extensin family protein [Pseudomonadota bacterium]
MRGLSLALSLCLVQGAWAQDIDRSPRPPANPRLAVAEGVLPVAAADAAPAGDTIAVPESVLALSLRPQPRPAALAERLAALRAASNAPGLDLSGDVAEGDEIDLAATPPPTRKEERRKRRDMASKQGSVCGVASIKGEEIARISSRVQGCGIEDPVAITSVAGVRLSQTATVDCSVATALNDWVDEVVQPAFGGRLVEMQVAAHYICRSRNNIAGAKISEHGKGRAVDLTAFRLSDGKVLTVRDNYNRILQRAYKAACGYFKTTLGPGSDGFHEDNLHFDTAQRNGGAYCR